MDLDRLIIYLETLLGMVAAAAGTLALAWLRRLNKVAIKADKRSQNNRTVIRRLLEHITDAKCGGPAVVKILDDVLEDNPEDE